MSRGVVRPQDKPNYRLSCGVTGSALGRRESSLRAYGELDAAVGGGEGGRRAILPTQEHQEVAKEP